MDAVEIMLFQDSFENQKFVLNFCPLAMSPLREGKAKSSPARLLAALPRGKYSRG